MLMPGMKATRITSYNVCYTKLLRSQPGLFAFSDDGQRRLARIVPVLEQALRRRGSLPLRQLVESTWVALGGPACVDAAGLADARRFLALSYNFV